MPEQILQQLSDERKAMLRAASTPQVPVEPKPRATPPVKTAEEPPVASAEKPAKSVKAAEGSGDKNAD